MKDYMTEKKLFNESILEEKGYLETIYDKRDKTNIKKKMRNIKDCMEPSFFKNKNRLPPKNICHLFQVATSDFGLE